MEGSIPRPEHPRPDRYREDWINLNGVWGFRFDDYLLGEDEKWYLDPESYIDRKILVPYPPESELSGIRDPSPHRCAWYYRIFELPSRSGRVLLHFGAVDYETKVWFNSVELGTHIGGFSPFYYEITKLVEDQNILVVRARDEMLDQPCGKQDPNPWPRGTKYTRVTGIWQTVWIEYVGETFIEEFYLTPLLSEQKVRIEAVINGEYRDLELEIVISFTGFEIAKKTIGVTSPRIRLDVDIEYLRPWSPEEPNLYYVDLVLLRGNEVVDKVTGYFGMREVGVSNREITLNGRPYYLIMALDQRYYPKGVYTAPTDEDLRRDVEYAKRLGLNGIRCHQKPADPRFLYWCDKIGLLVWEEMGDWGMSLRQENFEPFWNEWRTIVLRDYNHPSIIAWVPFNERAPKTEKEKNFIVEIYRRTKRLDPTRLVVDNSGYYHTETDIVDIHDYTTWKGVEDFKAKWRRVREVGDLSPLEEHVKVMANGFKYENQPIVISEFGGWGIKKYKPIIKRPPCYYGRILEDEYEFINKYRDVVLAIAEESTICGFCYTQLYDIEGEVNGYLTYDRKWKVVPSEIFRIHERVKKIVSKRL